MEFQVVEKLAAGYLIGRDVTCAHKAIIDEEAGYITFPLSRPPFKVPITEGNRFNKTKTDSRVHAAERAILKPHSEEWYLSISHVQLMVTYSYLQSGNLLWPKELM